MSKCVFERKNDGRITYRWAPDEELPPAGAVVLTDQQFGVDDPAKPNSPDAYLANKVWDAGATAPREQTSTEALEAARTLKRHELEAAFNRAWTAQFDDPVFAVVAYFELKTDARTVAVTAAKNNLIAKENTLNGLGTGGNNKPLTLENIAAIVW